MTTKYEGNYIFTEAGELIESQIIEQTFDDNGNLIGSKIVDAIPEETA